MRLEIFIVLRMLCGAVLQLSGAVEVFASHRKNNGLCSGKTKESLIEPQIVFAGRVLPLAISVEMPVSAARCLATNENLCESGARGVRIA